MELTKEDVKELQRLYDKAVKDVEISFMFKDQEILVAYAKYMLEYLKGEMNDS